MPFGYETAWFAVRSDDPHAVARALGVRTAMPASWCAGLTRAVDEGIFVTPSVDGWVFAVGVDAFQRGDCQQVSEALQRLGAACGPAFWFATHARVDVHGWACADGQRLVRAYLYEGDQPRVVWDEGDKTPTEQQLGYFEDDPRDTSDDDIKWWPTPADVMRLAKTWTLDPCALGSKASLGTGHLGRL